jgi:hypothetical protein
MTNNASPDLGTTRSPNLGLHYLLLEWCKNQGLTGGKISYELVEGEADLPDGRSGHFRVQCSHQKYFA